MTMEIEMKNIQEAEGLETPEGLMKPLIFGERLGVIHLEIPAGLEVSPHAHTTEGVLYCLCGELDVISEDETLTLSSETAMLVPPNTEIGIKNRSNTPVNALLISSPPPVKSVEELKDLLKSHE
ncbi:MAG TPA: cupin domain-containing protein [Methanosarcinaceae archaeon]|nr:cupin domain-containing protein [Methanosarcinaceae archaeon]